MDWVRHIEVIGISSPLVIGLSLIFGKFWAARILEKDKVKYQTKIETLLHEMRTSGAKELLVHRIQFEKEFEVYKHLWKAALELCRAANHFRMLQLGPGEGIDSARTKIEQAWSGLKDAVFDNQPFYVNQVYEIAKRMQVTLAETDNKNWFRNQLLHPGEYKQIDAERVSKLDVIIETKLDEINQLLEKLCEAIRNQVWTNRDRGPEQTERPET